MSPLKSPKFYLLLLPFLLPLLAGAQQTNLLYWDLDGPTEGAGGTSPSGSWDAFSANWSTNVDGMADATLWLDGNIAIFAAGTNAADPYTVSVGNTVTADSIQFEEGTVNLTGAEVDLAGTGTISVAAGVSAQIDSTLGGSAGLTKSGPGSLTLGSVGIYSGATAITEGSLALGASEIIPDNSPVSVARGGTFDLNDFTETIGSLSGDGKVALAAGTLIAGRDGNSTTFSGGISGPGGQLVKTGFGVLTLAGTNTYSGATTISSGSLALGAMGVIPDNSAVSVAGGASFELNGFSETVGSLSGDGVVNLGAGTLVTGGDGSSTTFSSAIQGAGGLTKTGGGVFTLNGANSYGGATTVAAGTLACGAAGVIPDNSAVSITSGAGFNLSGFTETIGSLSGAGNVSLGSGALTTGGDGTSTTFSGIVSGAGGQLTKTGAGVLTLSGANNYTGATTINGGSIRLGIADCIADTSAVSVASGATFNLNNFSDTVGSLAGAGAVTLGSGTLSAGSNNTSTTFSGNITGSGGIIKKGTGKLTLTGSGSSYTGSTRIEAGTLSINATTPLGSAASLLNLAGGTLDISASRSITNPVSLTASSQLSGAVASGVLTTLTFLSGTFNNTGGTLTIRNTGTSGRFSVRLRTGGLNITRPIVIGQAGDANNAATNAILRCDHQSGGDQIISGNISGPGIFERNSNLSLGGFRTILTGTNSYSGRTDLRGGLIGIGSATALGRAPITIGYDPQLPGFFASGAARVVTNSITFEAITTAATNLILSGSLPLTFTGPVALNPANVCRLLVSNGMVATFSGVISGSRGLEKAITNTLILSGANLYSGVTVVSGGTLLVNNTTGSGTGTSTVNVNSGATLGGTGRISGSVTLNNGSRISPGTNTASMGLMTLQNGLNLGSGGTNVWELNANSTSSPGVNFDQIALSGGNLALGGSSKLSISFTGAATVPNLADSFWRTTHSWTLVSLSGTATNLGSTRFPTILSAQYPSLRYFTNYADSRGNLILAYDPISPFYTLFDVGGGFFGGENFVFTNAPGLALSVWSSPTGGPSITNWTSEGLLGEQPLNDGSGNSRYSINLTPATSPVFYIAGRQTSGPYPATVPVMWITTDDFGAYTIFNTNAAINGAGVLDLPAAPDIIQQPVSKTVLVGKNPAFSVSANSFSPLGYRWYFNTSTPLAQGTNAALILSSVTIANSGNYHVVVANSYGSVTSSTAGLTVLPLPLLGVKAISYGFQFSANAVPGDSYVVQRTTNLTAPVIWSPVATNLADTNGIVQFSDTNITAAVQRFYRFSFP